MILNINSNAGSAQKVGSVGAVGKPAYDKHNNRVKGIFDTVVRKPEDLKTVFSQVAEVRKANSQSTRTTFRAFVDRELIENIRQDVLLSYHIEAVLPTNGSVQGCDLVYFGKNAPERKPADYLRGEEERNLDNVRSNVKAVQPHVAKARAANNGYTISLLEGTPSEGDVKTILSLYKEAYELYTFDINETTVSQLFSNGNKAIVARDSNNSIASMIISERCDLQLTDGSKVVMYEMSDFATFRKDRGNGLITALQIEMVKLLRRQEPDAVIYAEDRAPWLPVNKASAEAGLHYAGTLPFHCAIIADRDIDYSQNHQFESLNVWYAPF
ncbi:MAG: hypothetical protein WC506_01150 [Candidatus Micrarchaeia archaeon]